MGIDKGIALPLVYQIEDEDRSQAMRSAEGHEIAGLDG